MPTIPDRGLNFAKNECNNKENIAGLIVKDFISGGKNSS